MASDQRRAVPTTTPDRRARFSVQAYVLTTWPRRDAWDALAWLHNRSSMEYEHAMCSEWNVGNLVLPAWDWQPPTGKRPGRLPPGEPNLVPEMALCDRPTLDALRAAFSAMAKQDHLADRHEVHQSIEFEAYQRAFNDVARHIATGHPIKFLEPGGGEDEGWAPGADPLHCAVDGCTASAYLYRASRGQGYAMEAVCRADASHRWNPLNSRILFRASKAMRPACPYCGGLETAGGNEVELARGVRAFAYFCANCEPYFLLVMPFNAGQRMVWISQGTERENVHRLLSKHGLPNLDAVRKLPSPSQQAKVSAIALEQERLRQAIAKTDTSTFLGIRGPTLSEANLLLRFRIWEDLQRSFFQGSQFYIDYAVAHLGHEPDDAKFSVTYQVLFFRKHGYDHVIDRVTEDRTEERAYTRELILKDLRRGRIREPTEYLVEIRARFPAYTGKGPEILFYRVLEEFRAGKYAKIVARRGNPRIAEKEFLWERFTKDTKAGLLLDQAHYEQELRKAFPGYVGRGPQGLTHKSMHRFLRGLPPSARKRSKAERREEKADAKPVMVRRLRGAPRAPSRAPPPEARAEGGSAEPRFPTHP